MAESPQPQSPQPPDTCGSPGTADKSYVDMRLAVVLVTVAGAVILLLLFKFLHLRHRLSMARARHALEYYSFYHSGAYTFKHTDPSQDPPVKNGVIPDAALPLIATVTPIDIAPLPQPPGPAAPVLPLPAPPALPLPPILPPPPALPPPPILPPPPVHPLPTLPPGPPILALPLIYTTPPSPHPSLGACSDADVYSRIGAFRPSRLSSLSNRSTVILFEHSSL